VYIYKAWNTKILIVNADTDKLLECDLQRRRGLSSERAPHRQDNKFQTLNSWKGSNIWWNVQKLGSTPRHTDWLSALKLWLWKLLNHLKVAVVWSNNLVANSSGNQKKENVRSFKLLSLPSNGSEHWKDILCAVATVMFGMCNSAGLSQLFAVTGVKCPINPVTERNLVSSHNVTWKCSS
jgi:hypothetical protein